MSFMSGNIKSDRLSVFFWLCLDYCMLFHRKTLRNYSKPRCLFFLFCFCFCFCGVLSHPGCKELLEQPPEASVVSVCCLSWALEAGRGCIRHRGREGRVKSSWLPALHLPAHLACSEQINTSKAVFHRC